MVPPPGYGAGDFFQLIKLTVKIIKALQESREASVETQRAVQDLLNLQKILEFVQDLRPAGGDVSHVNAIRGLALSGLEPLREFEEAFREKYGRIATEEVSRLSIRQSSQQVRFALFGGEELTKFRSAIGAKVTCLGLLLGCFQTESLSRIESDHQKMKDELLEQVRATQESFQQSLELQAASNQDNLSILVEESYENVRDISMFAEDQAQSRHEVILRKADIHTEELLVLSRHVSNARQDMHIAIRGMHRLINEDGQNTREAVTLANARMQKLEEEMQMIQQKQNAIVLPMPEMLGSMVGRLKMFCAVGCSLIGNLVPYSKTALSYLQQGVGINLKLYAGFQKRQESFTEVPSESDFIIFEDVLGRTHSLPWTYFQHWDVFEAMLRCKFQGLPGERQVLRGQYILTSDVSAEVQIKKVDWSRAIDGKRRVNMSVLIEMPYGEGGICPKPKCKQLVKKLFQSSERSIRQCPICQTTFVPYSLHHRFLGPNSTASHKISGAHRHSKPVVRFPRGEPIQLSSDWDFYEGLGKDSDFQQKIRYRREQRLKQKMDETEQNVRDMEAFRRTHILFEPFKQAPNRFVDTSDSRNPITYSSARGFGRFRSKPRRPGSGWVPRNTDVQTALEELDKFMIVSMYGDVDEYHVSFEDLYRFAYKLVLRKQGDLAYDNLAFIIKSYIEDLKESALTKAGGESARFTRDQLHAETLHSLCLMWQRFSNMISILSDVFMYLDRVYVSENDLLGLEDLSRTLFRDAIGEQDFDDLSTALKSFSKSGTEVDLSDLEVCLDMVDVLERRPT